MKFNIGVDYQSRGMSDTQMIGAGICAGKDGNLSQIYFVAENLVLPPGCKPYGQEAGPGQRQSAMPSVSVNSGFRRQVAGVRKITNPAF